MANEGLGWDPPLKMSCHPGGDWNPGRGDNPNDNNKMLAEAGEAEAAVGVHRCAVPVCCLWVLWHRSRGAPEIEGFHGVV